MPLFSCLSLMLTLPQKGFVAFWIVFLVSFLLVFVGLSVCLFVVIRLCVFYSVSMFLCCWLFVCLCFCMFVSLSVFVPALPYVRVRVRLSMGLNFCLSVRLFVHQCGWMFLPVGSFMFLYYHSHPFLFPFSLSPLVLIFLPSSLNWLSFFYYFFFVFPPLPLPCLLVSLVSSPLSFFSPHFLLVFQSSNPPCPDTYTKRKNIFIPSLPHIWIHTDSFTFSLLRCDSLQGIIRMVPVARQNGDVRWSSFGISSL